VFSIDSGQCLTELVGHHDYVTGLALHPRNKLQVRRQNIFLMFGICIQPTKKAVTEIIIFVAVFYVFLWFREQNKTYC